MKPEEQTKKLQKLIAKAWADEIFKEKLLTNPAEALIGEGIDMLQGVKFRVVESTDKAAYLVLPPKPSTGEIAVEMGEARQTAFCINY